MDGIGRNTVMLVFCVLLGWHSQVVPGAEEMPHIKWSQPPIEIDPHVEADPVFCGWGEPARSTQSGDGRRQWRMDADDFRCLRPIPVTRIRWWGVYKAWGSPEPPQHQPEAWHIGFWANRVAGLDPNESYPERLVWSLEVPFERVAFEPVGWSEFPERLTETCFAYELALEPAEWFQQGAFESHEAIFWISITAIYPTDAPSVNMWGWQTRPHVWGRGAVMPAIMGEWPSHDERLFPGRIYPIESDALCGENQGFDMCFELLTEEPWIKWDLPFTGIRDWPWYADEMAEALQQANEELLELRLVADDWLCERPDPIVAVSWHGSYHEYGYEACQCEQLPEPRRPDYFLLALRTSAPPSGVESYEHPGEKIWEFKAEQYSEVLVGYDRNPEGEPNEPVFRYSVRLPEEAWFRQTEPETVYWFTVTPVFDEPVTDRLYHWGWTSHPHVFGGGALFVDYRLRMVPHWQAVRYAEDQAVDMSFEFFTVPPPRLVAHWRLDETEGSVAFDATGGHDGIVHGATWAEGKINGALDFNGLNDYVDCGERDTLGPQQMTWAAWLRPEHMGGARYIVSRARTGSDIDWAVLRHYEGEIEFTRGQDGSDPATVVSQGTTPLNEWSHVAATCDGGSICVYVNGEPDRAVARAAGVPRTGYQFVLSSLLADTRFYNGKMDDVRLYDQALPAERVAELMDQ